MRYARRIRSGVVAVAALCVSMFGGAVVGSIVKPDADAEADVSTVPGKVNVTLKKGMSQDPLSGVVVEIRRDVDGDGKYEEPIEECTTREDGRVVEGLPVGSYRVDTYSAPNGFAQRTVERNTFVVGGTHYWNIGIPRAKSTTTTVDNSPGISLDLCGG